ncbi:sca1 complex scaffold protein scaa [Anaeramoeba flamelloides]|uniref:Sca1 complex scaffold protein scaa n=1 Tax=Anaeramoeba flamelloides TaxID=1746091 RepID=A0AAV7YNR7_9EUKA|nr:sca1 complex scaffold protein scaa [Anaeramoeba flamelloides]
MSQMEKQKDSFRRKQYLGLRGAYEGPPINCSKKIESTKLENKNSKGVPVYLDPKGNFYDLYYLPLNNQKNEIKFRDKKISKKEDLDLILNNENQTRGKKNEIYSSTTTQNLENITSFPDPENYQTFEEFELASLEYQELIQEKVGLLQLPQLISSKVYRPKENRTKLFTETDQKTETETDMVTDLATETDLVTETEVFADFDDETIQQIKFQEDTPTLKQNEELKIYKMLEKGLLNDQLDIKKEEFSIDLKNVLMMRDPWDSALVPPEPKAKFYFKFEEYERAYRRWSQIVMKNVKHLPMHPRQLQNQALLKPYQKKIKKHSNKQFQDFIRDYSSWRNNIIKKIEHIQPFDSKFLPFKKNVLKRAGYIQQGLKKKKKQQDIILKKLPFSVISPNRKHSSSNFRKEVTYKELWSTLPEKSKTQIENIFDQFSLKITKNQKFYSSNISPILGRYQPVLQGSKSYRMKLSNYCIYRTDIKKEIAKTRFKCNPKIENKKINFIVPNYDLSRPIKWKKLNSYEDYKMLENRIHFEIFSYRFKKFYSRYNIHKIPIKNEKERGEKSTQNEKLNNMIILIYLHYYIEIILNEYKEESIKKTNSLIKKLKKYLKILKKKIHNIFIRHPKLFYEMIFNNIRSRTAIISYFYLFLSIRVLKMIPKTILPEEQKESSNSKLIINNFNLLLSTKYLHTQMSIKILLNLFKKKEYLSKFATIYSSDCNILVNQILKESRINKKHQKIIKDKNNDDVIQGNSYNLGIDDDYQNNFVKNGLSYKNILPVEPRNSTTITDYFLYIYKRLPESPNMIDSTESQLLSEKLYNAIIAQLKRNLTNQSRTISNIARLFQGMIRCLIKMKLIMGTVQNLKNSTSLSSPKKITASFKRLKKLSLKKGQINKSMLSPRTPNKNNNINSNTTNSAGGNSNQRGKNPNYRNVSYDNNKYNILNIKTNRQTDFQAKTIIVKEVRLLQILTIIKDAPSKAFKCKSLLIKVLIDILKVRSVFLDLYQSGLIFERLQEFCSDVRNFHLNKVSWKLFYTLILYHSETMDFLIKKELLKPFIDLLSVTSGVGVVNQLGYFNKLFKLDSIGRQNFDTYPIHQQIRYYESNVLKSYRKDCRLFINFIESKLHYTRLNSLYKSYIKTFNGAPFLQLSQVYSTIMSEKNCLRLYNEFKKSQEYKVAIIWYSNLLN